MAVRKEQIDVTVTGAQSGARDLDKLGRAVDDVGDELKGAAKDASFLDRELDRLQRTSHNLNREFARTGDKGLLKQIKEVKRDLGPLQAVRRELDKIAVAEEKARRTAAKEAATRGGGARAGVGGLSLPLSPATLAIAGTGLGLAAPGVFALAGGATLAAGGAGGAALGVAGAAANNPQIGKATTAALQDESVRWQRASRAFEEPTLRAIATIKRAVDEIPLEEILKNSAEFVDPLARGVAGFVQGIGKGVGHLIADAGPAVEELGAGLSRLGDAFEVMFDEIGQGAEGGARALHDLMTFTERMIVGTGKLIHFFEDWYSLAVKFRDVLPGDLWDDDRVKIIGFSQAIGGAGDEMGTLADATEEADRAASKYEITLHKLLDLPLDLAEASAQYQESLDALAESIAENGRVWDDTTAKGRANGEALRSAIQDAVAFRDAQIAMGAQSGDANRALDAQIAKLRADAIAAGMDAAAFDRLAGALRNYIAQPSVKVITTRFVTEGSAPRSSTPGRQVAFAGGGNFTPGYAVVGEEGPELVKFNGSGRVFNNAESRAMATQLGASQAGGQMSIEIVGNHNDYLYQTVMNGIRTNAIILKADGKRVTVG